MSSSPLGHTAGNTAHLLPSEKNPLSTSEMVQLQPAELSVVRAANMLWA